MSTGSTVSRKSGDGHQAPMRQRTDLSELKAVIARGDYSVPSREIAKRMLSARVFHHRKHG